jgi:hypothetical protein
MDETAWQLRPEELSPSQQRERVGCLVPFQAGEGGGVAQVRPVAEHGHGLGETGHLLGQAGQPRPHRPRHRLGAEPSHAGDLASGRLDAVGGQGAEELS